MSSAEQCKPVAEFICFLCIFIRGLKRAVILNSVPLPCCKKLIENHEYLKSAVGEGLLYVDIPRMKRIVFWNMT